MKWLITILVLAVLGGGGFAGFRYWTERQANDPAHPAQTLKGLRLGQDINDIQFEIGKRLPHAKVGDFVVYQHPVGPAGDDGAAADAPDTPEPPEAAVTAPADKGAVSPAGSKVAAGGKGAAKGDAARKGNAVARGDVPVQADASDKGDDSARVDATTKGDSPASRAATASGDAAPSSGGPGKDDSVAKGDATGQADATATTDAEAPAAPNGNASLRLFTADGVVTGISYGCAATADDTALDRIQCGQPLAQILRTYHGLELIQFCNRGDVLSRYVDLPRQGKSFLLVRNKVVELWIRHAGEDAQFPHEGGWHTCAKARKA